METTMSVKMDKDNEQVLNDVEITPYPPPIALGNLITINNKPSLQGVKITNEEQGIIETSILNIEDKEKIPEDPDVLKELIAEQIDDIPDELILEQDDDSQDELIKPPKNNRFKLCNNLYLFLIFVVILLLLFVIFKL